MQAVISEIFEETVLLTMDGAVFKVPTEFVPRNAHEGDIVDIFLTNSAVYDLEFATNDNDEIVDSNLITIFREWEELLVESLKGFKPVPLKGDVPIGKRVLSLKIMKNETATEKAKRRIQELYDQLLARNR